MTDQQGWFVGLDPEDESTAIERIRDGSADTPADWPTIALESGWADTPDAYYDRLQELTVRAAREEITERETAEDKQLIHAIRAMDDCERMANELAERVSEWGSSTLEATGAGPEYARQIAQRDPETAAESQLVETAQRAVDLSDRAADLRAFIEQQAPEIAPNLSTLAGPVLASRLIALAGGLDALAKMPSSTVQVLGAEDALFAHLRGEASSPKHGVIFMHEAVRGTAPEHRGSAARAAAGKFTIAARIDHYSGELRPDLETEFEDRIATIQARTGGEAE